MITESSRCENTSQSEMKGPCRFIYGGAGTKKLVGYATSAFMLAQFIGMIYWSWRKWPDILVDFGRELYLAWQIGSGNVLYKDIAHLFGPLSAYINGAAFYLFHPTYTTLIVLNIAFLSVLLFQLFFLVREASSPLAAFIACSATMAVCAFPQYLVIGNYNFISPYAHEATHGIALSAIMIYQLWLFANKNRRIHLILAGLLFGLIHMTKVDILVAASMAASAFFVFHFLFHKNLKASIEHVVLYLGCGILPVLLFLIYFLHFMQLDEALKAVNGAWSALIGSNLGANKFYLRGMGIDEPLKNIWKLVYQSILALSVVSVIAYLSHMAAKNKGNVLKVSVYTMLILIAVSLVLLLTPYNAGRPLPMLVLAACVVLTCMYVSTLRRARENATRILLMLLWAIFALGLLWKILLSCRFYHYGFYLTLPSVVLISAMFVYYFPQWLKQRYEGANIFRVAMVAMVAMFAIACVRASNLTYSAKNYPVGNDGDSMYAFRSDIEPRGWFTARAVEWIRANLRVQDTLVVLPEGVMINYLSRRTNPTPFINFMVPELQIYGEDVILDAFKHHSPDYIAIVHKSTAEYGVGFFGKDPDYGKSIMKWVDDNYTPIKLFGSKPLENNQSKISCEVYE